MNWTSYAKRFMSLLLCFVMVLGLMPVAAFAANTEVDYLVFATDRHENETVIGDILTNVIRDVGTVSYVGLGGDMVNDKNTSSTKWNSSTVLGEVTAVATNLSAENVDLVYASSHDMNCNNDAGIMNYKSGPMYTSDRYYVYGITQDEMGYNDASKAKEPAAAFTSWANGLAEDDDRVIIVLSHLPIHAQRGDNLGAGYWHNALNTAATGSATGGEIKRNVIFFHGHNHTTESNQEHFYAVGSKLSVESYVSVSDAAVAAVYNTEAEVYASSRGTSAEIYYTYATAGYLNANKNAMVVAISDETVTLTKYGTSSSTYKGSVERVVAEETTEETTEAATEETVVPTTEATEAVKTASSVMLNNGTSAVYTVGDRKIQYELGVYYTDGTFGTVTQDVCVIESIENTETGTIVTEAEALATPGSYAATVSYQGITCKSKVYFTVNDEGISNYHLLNLVINGATVNADVTEIEPIAVEGVTNSVAYNIPATLDEGVSEATVSIPIPEDWEIGILSVHCVVDGAFTEEEFTGTYADGYYTFTTSHFSGWQVDNTPSIVAEDADSAGQYVSGTDSETVVTTENVTIWQLVATPEVGKSYLIVNSNTGSGDGLDTDTSGYAVSNAVAAGVAYYASYADGTGTALADGTYIYTANGTTLWTMGSGNTFRNPNGTYLGNSDSTLDPAASSATSWSLSNNQLTVSVTEEGCLGGSSTTTYYVSGVNGWSLSSTAASVYFYEPVSAVKVTTTVIQGTFGGTYTVEGTDVTTWAINGETEELSYATYFTDEATSTKTEATPSATPTVTYEVVADDSDILTLSGSTITLTGKSGTASVKVTYAWGTSYQMWDTFTVTANAPTYEMGITDNGLEVSTLELNGVDANSTRALGYYLTRTTDTTANITPGTGLTWTSSNAAVATVDANGVVTFTGEPGTTIITLSYTGNGVVLTDTLTITVHEDDVLRPETHPDQFPLYPAVGGIRYDKTAVAVGNFSKTGIAQVELSMSGIPLETGGAIDVVLMLDVTGSMSSTQMRALYNATITFLKSLTNEGKDFSSNIAVGFFNTAGVLWMNKLEPLTSAEYTKIISHLESTNYKYVQTSGGTPYSFALKQCHDMLEASTSGLDQYCVFMSDGAPKFGNSDNKSFPTNGQNMAESVVSLTNKSNSDIYLCEDGTTSYGTAANVVSAKFPKEYWSTQMKSNGVTMYSVGLDIEKEDNVSAVNLQTLINGISNGEGYYYQVVTGSTTSPDLSTVFGNIAEEIKQAATNITVKDQITPEYTMIFDLPNEVSADDTGMSEFYIDVVEYSLDIATETRTDAGTVLKRVYIDAEGAYYYDGETRTRYTAYDASTNAEGVTVTYSNGEVATIACKYFTYDAATKNLTWSVTSLNGTKDIAIRYFLYLDDSAGVPADQQVDAGTYPTNVKATLNYTNIDGEKCQQVFPVPQMTWNGAHVSYVFYLVNDDGIPVNKNGEEVSFTSSVFVTDIFTESVTWNKEGTEGTTELNVQYLATDKLPDGYELYDADTRYEIHVYQDETGADAGTNYFYINSSVGIKRDNAKYGDYTTKVYMTKAGDRYDLPGYYTKTGGKVVTRENGVDTTLAATSTAVASDFDFANTTVAFAVKWKYSLTPDTVVVDYGLDVVVDVVANDMITNVITGVSVDKSDFGELTMNTATATASIGQTSDTKTVDGKDLYSVAVETDSKTSMRFTQHTMEFAEPVEVYYESSATYYQESEPKTGYLYSSLTVIPATTIYYEDTFVDLTTFTRTDANSEYAETDGWRVVGTANTDAVQDADRPGASNLFEGLDADNVYGYDSAYATSSYLSMGSASCITVNANQYGTAQFSFYGTGFDVISATANTTGTIVVQVYSGTNTTATPVKTVAVDTYYGYTYGLYEVTYEISADNDWTLKSVGDTELSAMIGQEYNGKTVAVQTKDNLPKIPLLDEGVTEATIFQYFWKRVESGNYALYQVPVIKVDSLGYNQYTVKITALYYSSLDHTSADGYDFYLDAIRIYDPAGTNTTANNAYAADGELLPNYYELRNQLIDAKLYANLTEDDVVAGIVFIDSNSALNDDNAVNDKAVTDYTNYGPNNELYLAAGQAIAFNLNASAEAAIPAGYAVDSVQIGLKTVGGSAAVAKLYNVAADGTISNTITQGLSTATDMYYDITALDNGTVVITNIGSTASILSVTNVKITYKAATAPASVDDPIDEDLEQSNGNASTTSMFTVSKASTNAALMSLATVQADVIEPVEPETEATEPETEPTDPETKPTEPETEPTKPGNGNKPNKPGNGNKPNKPGNGNNKNEKPGNGNNKNETPVEPEVEVPEKNTANSITDVVMNVVKTVVEFFFGGLLKLK